LQQRPQRALGNRLIRVRTDLGGDRKPRHPDAPEVEHRVDRVVGLQIAPEPLQPAPSRIRPTVRHPCPGKSRANRAARRTAQRYELEALAQARRKQAEKHAGREGRVAAPALTCNRDFRYVWHKAPLSPKTATYNDTTMHLPALALTANCAERALAAVYEDLPRLAK